MVLNCPRWDWLATEEKNSVLILDLNEPRVVAVLAFAESLFQTAGAATEKERKVNDVEAELWMT